MSNGRNSAMEEAKLVRMATAISQYTLSSMLQQRVLEAVEATNQAIQLLATSPWLSEQIQNDLREQQRKLVQLERQVTEDKLVRAREVEEAQKELMPGRPLQCQESTHHHPGQTDLAASPHSNEMS